MLENKQTYFASINSTLGFKSYFSSTFEPTKVQNIFILKGGPGTGKSTLMKSIAEIAEKNGQKVEYYLCSSDPDSLDGIVINENQIAIIDGTAPHTTDPELPGVAENIINLGSFWNTEKLINHKKEIFNLIREKKCSYRRAYQFLNAYGKIAQELQNYAKQFLNERKMLQNIKVQSNYFFQKQDCGEIQYRNIATVCKNGFLKQNTFEMLSNRIWIVEDHYNLGPIYLEAMREAAKEKNQSVEISFAPQCPNFPNGLYFPKSKVCVILGQRNYEAELAGKEYHYINVKRFLDLKKLAQGKQKIKFAEKCLKTLLSGAIEGFEEAAKNHQRLEQYYKASMNFEKLEEEKMRLLNVIFPSNSSRSS